jgi:multiple sugar transport system ATP-binding protein
VGHVELLQVSKRYGETDAVSAVSLGIQDHEFVVLLGPSGCGKSTLLKMIAGLEDVSDGEIYIDGTLVNYVRPADRNVAMVFQNYALYPHMTVAENIGFPLKMTGVSKQETGQRVQRAARSLGLESFLDRRPEQLSGGQRQRVALGRAIVREPAVFLMDEPLSNLDAQLRVQTREELLRLHARLQTTTIYVTHDQIEAMTMGHRIVVMRGGQVQQVGPPQEVYDEPANTFVAAFLGSPRINLHTGTLGRSDSGGVFRAREVMIPLGMRLTRP